MSTEHRAQGVVHDVHRRYPVDVPTGFGIVSALAQSDGERGVRQPV